MNVARDVVACEAWNAAGAIVHAFLPLLHNSEILEAFELVNHEVRQAMDAALEQIRMVRRCPEPSRN